jgi:hypothetical protein
MKKLFALLLFLMVPLAPVGAQGLHGKILIVRDTSVYFPHDFENVVPTIYFGTIDSMFSLPSDLSIYDAVLVKDDTLTAADQLSLIGYVKSGGKLYIESNLAFLASSQTGMPSAKDTLLYYLGLTSEAFSEEVARYDLFFGVDSEFTHGLSLPHAYDEINYDLADIYIPNGNFISVLFGEEVDPINDIFAWIPVDRSIRAVVQYYPGFYYGQKAEYYAPFVTRVLCDYFGLCVDAVKEAPPAVPTVTLRVVNDGVSTSLVVSSEETGTLDVMNALGVTVYHSSVNSGTSSIELPESLRNGVYFARLQTEHGGQVQPFAIVAK